MNNYIDQHKEKLEASRVAEDKFKQFCKGVYETGSLQIDPTEKEHFEKLRETENKDYEFRKKVFWPSWALGLLLFDQIITMPSSKGNKIRILFNIVLGIPFVSMASTGLIFYRESFQSHEYALTLCSKYKACQDSSTQLSTSQP